MPRSFEKVDSLLMRALLPFILAVTMFSVPVSSTAKSILIVLSLLSILIIRSYRQLLFVVIRKPWCIAILLFFLWVLLACIWSPTDFKEQLFAIKKYSKLLYLPILALGFTNTRTRFYSLYAFLLAMLLTCILAILKFHGFLQTLVIDPENVFRNHIMTGFMVAFAAYLSLMLIYQSKNTKARLAYGILTCIYTYHVLFVNGGRTGYVVYLLLMLLLVAQICTLKQAILGVLLLGSLFVFSYFQSPIMQVRTDLIFEQFKATKSTEEAKNSPIGLRIQFHDFAETLFIKHPIVGNGTASFTYYFDKIKPVTVWPGKLLEPHSLYWLVASEFGVIGLVLLVFLFFSLFQACWHLKYARIVGLGMLIPFFIGNLSDSLLYYSGSGYFFLMFMSLCLGEQLETQDQG